MIAGSGAQGGTLTNDLAYGHRYRFPSRWQFWWQLSTVLTCALVSALGCWVIRNNFAMTVDSPDLAAPVAKTWATMALLLDPNSGMELPPYAVKSMWIAGIIGVFYTLLERKLENRRWLPGSVGIGLGLILPVGYDFGFMFGGVVMYLILSKLLKFSEATLNTLAIALIVGEGMGGIIQSAVNIALK
jgi:hypothetical protein